MIGVWIPITLGAAFLQNLRTVLQRRATAHLSTGGVTFARFLYGFPAACFYLLVLCRIENAALPDVSPGFLAYAVIGGLGQILGNALLIRSFRYRNYLVATAYSKTEVAQTAILSAFWLGEAPLLLPSLGILLSLAGVVTLSLTGRITAKEKPGGFFEGPALMGLGVGAGYAIATICYRAGALSLAHGDAVLRAAVTLVWVSGAQALIMAVYLRAREPGMITRTMRAAAVCAPIGITGAVSSAAWFTAMSLQNVAYVRALGQAELLFTSLSSHHVFGERSTRSEFLGVALTVAGILLVLLGR